jgi:hypothetical protein
LDCDCLFLCQGLIHFAVIFLISSFSQIQTLQTQKSQKDKFILQSNDVAATYQRRLKDEQSKSSTNIIAIVIAVIIGVVLGAIFLGNIKY